MSFAAEMHEKALGSEVSSMSYGRRYLLESQRMSEPHLALRLMVSKPSHAVSGDRKETTSMLTPGPSPRGQRCTKSTTLPRFSTAR